MSIVPPRDQLPQEGEMVAVSLTSLLMAHVTALAADDTDESRAEGQDILDAVTGYMEQCDEVKNAKNASSMVAAVVDTHILQDQMRSPQTASRISCGKGCSHCCHISVAVDGKEADLIYEMADGWDEDEVAHMRRQAEFTWEEWMTKPIEQRRCIFLKNNTCSIYEFRPASCRKMFVVSPAEMCDTVAHPKGEIQQWFSLGAEVMATAASTVFGWGPMAEMILKRLGYTVK